MAYYNNHTPCQQQILQCIISTILFMIIVGLIMMGVEPSISIYILIPSISAMLLIIFINMLCGCYKTYQHNRLHRTLHTINPLPAIPPIVILQGNSIMVGTPIQSRPIEHMVIPIYMASIHFNK